jgi:hypothetical protein
VAVVGSQGATPMRQREQLSKVPSGDRRPALDRFFTLSGADLAEARQHRRDGPAGLVVVVAVRAADAGSFSSMR